MEVKSNPWKVLEEHIYEIFKIFRIRRSTRLNPKTGNRFDFFLMDGLDWVNVIPITEDNQVVLVSQYRHGSESVTLEIPGGCMEPNETPEEAAKRELKEETGYEAKELEFLGTVHPNPAMQAMRCHCFVAKDVKKVCDQSLDCGENIEVICKPMADIIELLRSGIVAHSIVLSAFLLFFLGNYAKKGGTCPG